MGFPIDPETKEIKREDLLEYVEKKTVELLELEETQKKIAQEFYGKPYKELSPEQKAIVDNHLATEKYLPPLEGDPVLK